MYMYLVKLYNDADHNALVRADRYPTVARAAYYLGVEPAAIYNYLRNKARIKGILKYVEINNI